MFRPKKDEIGEWRRFHNEELQSFYRSPYIVRMIECRRFLMKIPVHKNSYVHKNSIILDIHEYSVKELRQFFLSFRSSFIRDRL